MILVAAAEHCLSVVALETVVAVGMHKVGSFTGVFLMNRLVSFENPQLL